VDKRRRGVVLSGLFWTVVVIADVWAIINVVQSRESDGSKALWVVAILVFPLLGFVAWHFKGPKKIGG
jgi:hypothetical protein